MVIEGKDYEKVVLVTGGCGFIGSNLLNELVPKYKDVYFVNVDCMTYASNKRWTDHLRDDCKNYILKSVDIRMQKDIYALFQRYDFDLVIHLAAESHVDNSIMTPLLFLETNVMGTGVLLVEAMKHWSKAKHKGPLGEKPEFTPGKLFLHVSTDEVFGHLHVGDDKFNEDTGYAPRSPYSASKAGTDHLVRSYRETYGFPAVITNCTNNYGIYQFKEKVIPRIITSLMEGKKIPIYSKGENIRDWVHVSDHVSALETLSGLLDGRNFAGNDFCIGVENEWTNLNLANLICNLYDAQVGNPSGTSNQSIEFVPDRMGHDMRYAIDPAKMISTGWSPKWFGDKFPEILDATIAWYRETYK
jgi:dTDP-glucose 4,6-dehydratase